MDFEELVAKMSKIGNRRIGYAEQLVAQKDKRIRTCGVRVEFVETGEEISELRVFGDSAYPIHRGEVGLVEIISDVANKYDLGFTKVKRPERLEEGVHSKRYDPRRIHEAVTFCIESRPFVEGELEDVTSRIYAAQKDLISYLSGNGTRADTRSASQNKEVEKQRKLLGKGAIKIRDQAGINSGLNTRSILRKSENGKGFDYDAKTVHTPDGRCLSIKERNYELGTEMDIYMDFAWKDVAAQLEKETGLTNLKGALLRQLFCTTRDGIRSRPGWGCFVGPIIRTIAPEKRVSNRPCFTNHGYGKIADTEFGEISMEKYVSMYFDAHGTGDRVGQKFLKGLREGVIENFNAKKSTNALYQKLVNDGLLKRDKKRNPSDEYDKVVTLDGVDMTRDESILEITLKYTNPDNGRVEGWDNVVDETNSLSDVKLPHSSIVGRYHRILRA